MKNLIFVLLFALVLFSMVSASSVEERKTALEFPETDTALELPHEREDEKDCAEAGYSCWSKYCCTGSSCMFFVCSSWH
uniref:U32-Theraphotoxin-Sfo1a_1 n=1 Tax=Selenotholus foelschei TaxID=1905327 RepID=A0A482ZAM5_9ARAC